MAKRNLSEAAVEESTSKRAKLLDDESEDEDGSTFDEHALNINKEYASRFEHNKKREEKQRLEEKYGPNESGSEEDSSSEDDDEGELITENVDQDILATIKAIKAKDPRIYDAKSQFFADSGVVKLDKAASKAKEKPMNLQDYHRKNLLADNANDESEDDFPAKSYAQEQQELKEDIVKQMHAAGEDADENDDSEDSTEFLVRKSKPVAADAAARHKDVELDIKGADKDPETFLSNFLSSNAWRTTSPSRFQPFDSDDEDELERADEFEETYNRRFEDPKKFNASLHLVSRDHMKKYSVRREELSGRQKARQVERERKDADKADREEEKSRLKKLKADEMEKKVKQIRKSAGARSKDFHMDEWADVLEGDFNDEQWEAEMQRRFGDDYYNADDFEGSEGDNDGLDGKKRKPKKPKWDDDIDIKDIVPDFSGDEGNDQGNASAGDEGDAEGAVSKAKNSKKERMRAKEEAKRTARRDRRLIENLVEQNIDLGASSSKDGSRSAFRYRQTSPTSFGMTSRDILLASDADLNQFAGLKKLHAFRDMDKKKKDKKNLSKKARLRQWRKDTFGDADEPTGGFERLLNGESGSKSAGSHKSKVKNLDVEDEAAEGEKKKKKRSRKAKKVDIADA